MYKSILRLVQYFTKLTPGKIAAAFKTSYILVNIPPAFSSNFRKRAMNDENFMSSLRPFQPELGFYRTSIATPFTQLFTAFSDFPFLFVKGFESDEYGLPVCRWLLTIPAHSVLVFYLVVIN